jgi:hypothetical protein
MSFFDKLEKIALATGIATKVEPTASQPVVVQDNSKVSVIKPPTATVTGVVTANSSTMDQAKVEELKTNAKNLLFNAMANDGAPLVEEIDDVIDTLKEDITDEGKLHNAALKMLGKKGHSPVIILNDFDKCLAVLDDNKRSFEETQKTLLESKIGDTNKRVHNLESDITGKQNEIQKLQNDIVTLTTELNKQKSNISVEQSKLEQVKICFNEVFTAIRNTVQERRNKIATYSKGSN